MNVGSLGNTIYFAIKDTPQACTAIRTEFAGLALSLATNPGATALVTSATVNGQSFSAQPTMTNGQRLKLLRWIVACLNNGGAISTTQISNFG